MPTVSHDVPCLCGTWSSLKSHPAATHLARRAPSARSSACLQKHPWHQRAQQLASGSPTAAAFQCLPPCQKQITAARRPRTITLDCHDRRTISRVRFLLFSAMSVALAVGTPTSRFLVGNVRRSLLLPPTFQISACYLENMPRQKCDCE